MGPSVVTLRLLLLALALPAAAALRMPRATAPFSPRPLASFAPITSSPGAGDGGLRRRLGAKDYAELHSTLRAELQLRPGAANAKVDSKERGDEDREGEDEEDAETEGDRRAALEDGLFQIARNADVVNRVVQVVL